MPFINKLAACWHRQNNLLSNPIIPSVPGWLMIPVHHDLEESKESWLFYSSYFQKSLLHRFLFFCPCLIASLVMWRTSQDAETQSMESEWSRQGTQRHSLPTPSQSLQTRLPSLKTAGMLTGSFSLHTGTEDAGDDKEAIPAGYSSWLYAPCSAAGMETWPSLLYQLPSLMKSLWASHRKCGNRGAGKKEQECCRLQWQQRTKIRSMIWALKQSWFTPKVSFLFSKGGTIFK